MARQIETVEELKKLYEEFNEEIRSNDYEPMPTNFEFSRWLRRNKLKIGENQLWEWLKDPAIATIKGETIVQGAAAGKYKEAISIFALKNWCKMADKQEVSAKVEATISDSDAADALEALGYVKR